VSDATELVTQYKALAERYLDVSVSRTQADEAELLGELDTLWWQMSESEREAIEEWNQTSRGER